MAIVDVTAATIWAVVALPLALAQDSSGNCLPGYGTTCSDGICVECTECGIGYYSLGGNSSCVACPTGSFSAEPGSSVCDCKENYYFDEMTAASTDFTLWPTLGCTDCTQLFSTTQHQQTIECPGGQTTSTSNSSIPRRRRLSTNDGAAMYAPRGPMLALSGWYIESKACAKGDETLHQCITRHACGDSMCLGLPELVRKEVNEMSEAAAAIAANDHTDWCIALHQMALDKGASEADLVTLFEFDNGTKWSGFFFHEKATCKERYITAIYDARKVQGYGVVNYCYSGHNSSSRACATCEAGLEKGDDGLCHNCTSYSLWKTVEGDVYTIFVLQIPYTLFMKSGRPQALKSAMFASFMFFMQTVSLLGKDSGYFLGDALDDEDKSTWMQRIDTASRFLSANMAMSGSATVVNETVAAEDVCPITMDRHERFFKTAVLKSIFLLLGVVVWHHALYYIFVYSRLHYYLLGCFGNNDFMWNTEIKALWQEPTYPSEFDKHPDGTRVFHAEKGWKGCVQRFVSYISFGLFFKPERGPKKMMPFREKSVYGASAVMLDFHTCHILIRESKKMQDAKHQVARVQARAHFIHADKNRNQTLDREELGLLLQEMGERPTEEDIDDIFHEHSLSSEVMTEDQFVNWWVARRVAAKRLVLARTHKACSCCDRKHLRNFRPQGTAFAEAVLSCADQHQTNVRDRTTVRIHPQMREILAAAHVVQKWRNTCASRITCGCRRPSPEWIASNHQRYDSETCKTWKHINDIVNEKDCPKTWFTGDQDDHEAFQQHISTVTAAPPERIRINSAYPISQREIMVSFDVLPEGYVNNSKECIKPPHPDDPTQPMSSKDFNRRNVNAGLKVRALLDAAFIKNKKIRDGVVATHLDQPLMVDMKNANPEARFFRAVIMLCTTVLYYPVIQDTLPIIHCTDYPTNQYWDRNTGTWVDATLINSADQLELSHEYLNSDRSVVCDGAKHVYTKVIAYIVLACCVVVPYLAYLLIRKGKHEAYMLATKEAEERGQTVAKKVKKGIVSQIFTGIHYPISRREVVLFEQRILRDPLSGLYAMCEPRAYYWFFVDLMRKAITTVIYTFGRNVFDWQFVMMIVFVLFAVGQDVAQPYRGRSENLFSFMTLMFIIVLIYTTSNNDSTSLLPLVIMCAVVGCTLIIFVIGSYFAKRQTREEAAEHDRHVRSARRLWGHVAKHVLLLNPTTSSDEDMRAAFSIFDDIDFEGKAAELRASMGHEGKGGDGRITRGELMALRDDNRKIHDIKIPKLEDDGIHTPCFQATEDEIDDMIAEADTKGTGDCVYDEFVAAIFNSWEQQQQTDMLAQWLYSEYDCVDMSNYQGETKPYQLKLLKDFSGGAFVPLEQRRGCTHVKHQDGKHIGLHQRYLNRTGSPGSRNESPLVRDYASFCGMLEAIANDATNPFASEHDSEFHGFKVDLEHLHGIIGLQAREHPLGGNAKVETRTEQESIVELRRRLRQNTYTATRSRSPSRGASTEQQNTNTRARSPPPLHTLRTKKTSSQRSSTGRRTTSGSLTPRVVAQP